MVIHFLVEDVSGELFLKAFMEKYISEFPEQRIDYSIHHYQGIGEFPKSANAMNNKSKQLLSDLPKRLKALNVALSHVQDASVFVVIDNDTRNTEYFRSQLEQIIIECRISIDHVFCIAVEEMEAWLLGDAEALKAAYPQMRDRIATKLQNYRQDSICGTWEMLAEIVTKGGMKSFKKMNPSPNDIGMRKSEWAKQIGSHLNIRDNLSPSFQYMVEALDQRRSRLSGEST